MDKEAFVSELEAYQSMLYRVAYTILRDDDACRDALQDAALKAWEKRFTLREPNFFRTWITRILINACQDIHRKRRRLVCMERLPIASAPPPDPELAVALACLPEGLRLPLVLRYAEGMSYDEIAHVMRLSQSTVRSRLRKGKEKLRKELEEA